jgi:hypothetical protein
MRTWRKVIQKFIEQWKDKHEVIGALVYCSYIN